jgi:1,4-alpha-glucan branching enzyme
MRYLFFTLALLLLKPSIAQQQPQPPQVRQLPWTRNAVIYEVNVRQFSASGKLNEVTNSLSRLKNLGVDVLWLMPLHPIGELNRKGKLGSYYSVKDYRKIDPSYGDSVDLNRLIIRAHGMGMRVIIDWVANHTAWDHPWITQHPDWYVQNDKGQIQTQYDWTDVAKLNFKKPEMRKAMIEDMRYWINNYNIDGFRCDVAFLVPVDFWDSVRVELDKTKPMFMLAEMEWNTDINPSPATYFTKAFNASYGWTFMGVTQDMVAGKKDLNQFRREMEENYSRFPKEMLKMFFITNHDENSWNGTIKEKYSDSWQLYATLCYTLPQSFPLMYTGEEAGINRRIKFFDKDPILLKEWSDTSRYAWYRTLIQLRHINPALWNVPGGEDLKEIALRSADTAINNKVYAFIRKRGQNEVAVLTNFSETDVVFDFSDWRPDPTHKALFNSTALFRNKNNRWVLRAKESVVMYK